MAITTNVNGATKQITSYTNNGFTTDTVGGVVFPLQQGVPYQNIYTFKVIPADVVDGCVAPAQSWPGSTTSLTLNTADTVSGTQIVTTYLTSYLGSTGIQMDCERGLSIFFSEETTAATTVTVSGYDYRGISVQQATTFADSTAANSHNLNGQFSVVTSVILSANPGGTISIGNQNPLIGLPYLCVDTSYFVSGYYGTNTLNSSDIANAGAGFRGGAPTADTDQPYGPRGAANLPVYTDGTSILVMTYFVQGSDSEMNGELANTIQSTINLCQVVKNPAGYYVWPYLTSYDLVGMQYPGDLTIAETYNALIDA